LAVSRFDFKPSFHPKFLRVIMPEQEKQSKEIRFIRTGHHSLKLDNDVHVWRFPVGPTDLSLLTEIEREVEGQYRLEADKNRYSVGRQALRFLLSKYLSAAPLAIEIEDKGRKKPMISNPVCDIHFNISHSGEWVLIGMARNELGIDIEKINLRFEFFDLLDEHFNEAERSYISGASNPTVAFYYLWTRKEALTKAWGTGLQENLKTVSVLEAYTSVDHLQKSWKLESFDFSALYQSALAFCSKTENVMYFEGDINF
jgi:4'-phosphopantetheinyl transferase